MAVRAVSRRVILAGCLASSGAVRSRGARADEPVDPRRTELPQPGDQLIEVGTDPDEKPIKPDDMALQDLVLAWALDPRANIVRDQSRLNMVLLMRFDPASLDAAETPMALNGIVAYSAVCTHQQCWVTDWLKSAQVLQCPCHQSRYDLRHGAKVVGGPAPRPLPALPLKLSDGVLSVAGPFTSRVGGEQPSG
jgi:Rieske Fe-S protein